LVHPAPGRLHRKTFRTKTDADRWLSTVEADLTRGIWLDDNLSRQPFGTYARAWLRDHPKMGPRYRETCERNLRLHMTALGRPAPTGHHAASRPRTVRLRAARRRWPYIPAVIPLPEGSHEHRTPRCGAIQKNPCNIPGAGTDRARERPIASPAQIVALIEVITSRYRAAVLLAAWCGLRRGEVLGLLPEDVDLAAATVTIRRNRIELLATPQAFDADPKTDAGKRTIAIPPHVLPFLTEHMMTWAGSDRVFIGRDGRPMRGDAIRQAFTRAAAKSACLDSASTIKPTSALCRPAGEGPAQRGVSLRVMSA